MTKRFLDNFILVEYDGIPYPEGYSAKLQEVAAHFDKECIAPVSTYSMHTEYSFGSRNFNTNRIAKYPTLMNAHKGGVPQLWKSSEWANEFADFVIDLSEGFQPPTVVEIHPPFNDYCTIKDFASYYQVFEEKIHRIYPDTVIVIENRAGKRYRGGQFLVSKAKEIAALCEVIHEMELNLGIVLDFPQLLTAENIDPYKFKAEKYEAAIATIAPHRDLIKGIHVWGKRKNASGRQLAHQGNFDTYFGGNDTAKNIFISGIRYVCNDGLPRFFVPEVHLKSAENLAAIVQDLEQVKPE